MGTKEFRNWLGNTYLDFRNVRDASVDNEIDRLARMREELMMNNGNDEASNNNLFDLPSPN